MNSTSAGDSGGNFALLEGGRILVGWPGAPGCTTTEAVEPSCSERAGEGPEAKENAAASNAAHLGRRILALLIAPRSPWIDIRCGIGAKPKLEY
jgi:hypothetical protein